MYALLASVTLIGSLHIADTTISFGVVRRDLTGDGIPETLTLMGTGPTLDRLQVTFSVQSSGQTIFSNSWPFTRPVDGSPKPGSDAALRSRLEEYGPWFFADSKFMSPSAFLTELQRSARLHIDEIPNVINREVGDSARARILWEHMRASTIIIFEFSRGGDAITAIGWSATDKRFYHLFECC